MSINDTTNNKGTISEQLSQFEEHFHYLMSDVKSTIIVFYETLQRTDENGKPSISYKAYGLQIGLDNLI